MRLPNPADGEAARGVRAVQPVDLDHFATWARVRCAIGVCVGVDPDKHADAVTRAVEAARDGRDLMTDLQGRAAALASADGTRRPRTEGA